MNQILREVELTPEDLGRLAARAVAEEVGIGADNFDSFDLGLIFTPSGKLASATVTLFKKVDTEGDS